MDQLAIDQSIVDLANTMQDVYSFVDEIERVPSKITLLEDVIRRIFVQTVECAIFIREYSAHGFAGMDHHISILLWYSGLEIEIITGRVLRETMGASTPVKVAAMATNLIKLQDRFNASVTLQIAVVSFRMHEDVTAIRE